MQWLTARKGLFCALRPRFWPHMRSGVAPSIEHIDALSHLDFKTIVDVGANRGQFSTVARWLFPEAQIFAFEPLENAADVFSGVLANDPHTTLFRNAVGASSGVAQMFVTARDDSSSLLKPGKIQSEVFGTQTSRMESVAIKPLADCIDRQQLTTPALLKIDVQGAELSVLEGSESLIDCFDSIYVECSYVRLYEGQPLYADIANWTEQRGFRLAGVFNQHIDPSIGPTQADFLFRRHNGK